MQDQAEQLREMMQKGIISPNDSTESNLKDHKIQRNTKIITVASGKGGVGKTNMAINLAIAYAKTGKKVIILDADLGLANVNVIMGIVPKYNLFHIIKHNKKLQDIIINTDYGIQLIAGASGFFNIANLSEYEKHNLLQEMLKLTEADIIVIDTSAGISDNVLTFVEIADEVLIITTPEPTAITDAYGIIKVISTEIKELSNSLKLIVNRTHSISDGKKISDKVIGICGDFLNFEIEYLGFIFEDENVGKSVLAQKPFSIAYPKTRAVHCLDNIVAKLEQQEVQSIKDHPETRGLNKLIQRFFK